MSSNAVSSVATARKTLRAHWACPCAPYSAIGSRRGRGFIESSEGRLSTNGFNMFVAKLSGQYLHSLIERLGRAAGLPDSRQCLTEPLAGHAQTPTRGGKAAENGDLL